MLPNTLLKSISESFDDLSTNGKYSIVLSLAPFALRFSKGERRVFSNLLAHISHRQSQKRYTLSIERRDRKSEAVSEQFQWRVWCLVRRLPFLSGIRFSNPVCGPLQSAGPLPRSGELASRSLVRGEKCGLAAFRLSIVLLRAQSSPGHQCQTCSCSSISSGIAVRFSF